MLDEDGNEAGAPGDLRTLDEAEQVGVHLREQLLLHLFGTLLVSLHLRYAAAENTQ